MRQANPLCRKCGGTGSFSFEECTCVQELDFNVTVSASGLESLVATLKSENERLTRERDNLTTTAAESHVANKGLEAEIARLTRELAELEAWRSNAKYNYAIAEETRKERDILRTENERLARERDESYAACFDARTGERIWKSRAEAAEKVCEAARGLAGQSHYEWCDLIKFRQREVPPPECDCGVRVFTGALTAWRSLRDKGGS